MAGWLLPFIFSFAIHVGEARVAGVVTVLLTHEGSLLLIDLRSLRTEIIAGGVCLTSNVRQTLVFFIVIIFASEICTFLNCECLSW